VHEWLMDNVYKKFGGGRTAPDRGRRHPYCGLFATFLASGLFHEYIISLASNTLNGFMLAYFMTQFFLVVFSISVHHFLNRQFPGYARVRLTRPFKGIKWLLTLSCVLLPVPLFIHNFEKVFPLHTF
ncbi:MAG: MBOAT family O-acyltransferase, partial [Candidatus Brocadiales bacterium]